MAVKWHTDDADSLRESADGRGFFYSLLKRKKPLSKVYIELSEINGTRMGADFSCWRHLCLTGEVNGTRMTRIFFVKTRISADFLLSFLSD